MHRNDELLVLSLLIFAVSFLIGGTATALSNATATSILSFTGSVTGAALSGGVAILVFQLGRLHDRKRHEHEKLQQVHNLARSLHAELADRVARCCYDFEAPYKAYYFKTPDKPRDSFAIRKFVPAPPVIYPAIAAQISILGNQAPTAVIQFYFRLAVCQRDFESIAARVHDEKRGASIDELRMLTDRLWQALAPGLKALQTLGPMIKEHEEIENSALAAYDDTRSPRPAEHSLRNRVQAQIDCPKSQ